MKPILVLTIVLLMAASSVSAQQPLVSLNELFGSEGFSGWYENYSLYVDFVVFLTLFIFICNFVIAKQNKITKQLEAWGTGSGVLLAVLFTLIEFLAGFRLEDTQLIGLIIILLIVAVSSYFNARLAKLDYYGSAGIAFIITYVVYFSVSHILVGGASESIRFWTTSAMNILVIIAIVAFFVGVATLVRTLIVNRTKPVEAEVNQEGNLSAESAEQDDAAEELESATISRLCERAASNIKEISKNFVSLAKLMQKGTLEQQGNQVNEIINATQPKWTRLQNLIRLISKHTETLSELEAKESRELEAAVSEALDIVSEERKREVGLTDAGRQKPYGRKTIEEATNEHLAAARQELANKVTLSKNQINTALGNALEQERAVFEHFKGALDQFTQGKKDEATVSIQSAQENLKQLSAILTELGKTDMDQLRAQISQEMTELKNVDHIAELARQKF